MGQREQTWRQGRAYWVRLAAEFERGEETQAAFCQRRDVEVGKFRYWLYRLRREQRDAPSAVQFVPLVAAAASPGGLRLRLCGVELDFAEVPPADYLASLLRLMDR